MNKSHTTPGLEESTRTLAAFADPVRLRLLSLLAGEHEEICVCHLHEALGLPQPTVSRHLAYLRKHRLVVGRKQGLWVHYQLTRPQSGLCRILLACLGTSLGDPELFAEDRRRLNGLLDCCGEP
jgi:ArsR family transcriptional regulator